MVYDTGAMGTSVSWELAKRLGIVKPITGWQAELYDRAPGEVLEEIVYEGRTDRATAVGVGGLSYGMPRQGHHPCPPP